jgi:hypothetical protein
MRKIGISLCGWLMVMGLWGSPVLAQKRSVAEEILDILRAEHQISDEKYYELLNKAKAENEAREAGLEAFRRDPVKDVKKSIDWLDRFTFSGDLRVRSEGFFQERGPDATSRIRERIRLRFGATMKITDEVLGGIRLASGDPNDPITTNQTLTDLFTRKPISIDQAYITLTPKQSIGLGEYPWNPISITGGKFANPVFRPRAVMNSEMIWDDDLTPEGFSETFTLWDSAEGLMRRFQINTLQWTARENAKAADAWVLGGQVVGAFQILPRARLTLAAADYYFAKSDFMAQARNTNTALVLTNSVVLKDGTVVKGGFPITPGTGNKQIQSFLGGFNLINPSIQLDYDTGDPRWPFALMADGVYNSDAPRGGKDWAIWTGVSLGATKNPGDWAFSALWGHVETDSVVSFFSYSDFGRRGGTNVEGPFVKIDYMLFPRLVLTARHHFVSFIDRPKGQSNSMVNRLQLDAVLSF